MRLSHDQSHWYPILSLSPYTEGSNPVFSTTSKVDRENLESKTLFSQWYNTPMSSSVTSLDVPVFGVLVVVEQSIH